MMNRATSKLQYCLIFVTILLSANRAAALSYFPDYVYSSSLDVRPVYLMSQEEPFLISGLLEIREIPSEVSVYTVGESPELIGAQPYYVHIPLRSGDPIQPGEPVFFEIRTENQCWSGMMPAGIEYQPGGPVVPSSVDYFPRVFVPNADIATTPSMFLHDISNETQGFHLRVEVYVLDDLNSVGFAAPHDAMVGDDRKRRSSFQFRDSEGNLLFETEPLVHDEWAVGFEADTLQDSRMYFGPPYSETPEPPPSYYYSTGFSTTDESGYYLSETVPSEPMQMTWRLEGYKPVTVPVFKD